MADCLVADLGGEAYKKCRYLVEGVVAANLLAPTCFWESVDLGLPDRTMATLSVLFYHLGIILEQNLWLEGSSHAAVLHRSR
jgi:hypothetical protein